MKEETKKCIICGRPATKELLDILDKRTLDICDLYPRCAGFKQVSKSKCPNCGSKKLISIDHDPMTGNTIKETSDLY